MVKRLKPLLSLFGASGYRYKFLLFTFDGLFGVEDAFPAEGAVFLLLARGGGVSRRRSRKPLYIGETADLSSLSVGALSKIHPALVQADCIAVLYESDAATRRGIAADVVNRNFV